MEEKESNALLQDINTKMENKAVPNWKKKCNIYIIESIFILNALINLSGYTII